MTKGEIEMLADLKNLLDNDDLGGFEADFVDSMSNRDESYRLSEKQADKLEQIWNKHCGN